MCSDYKNSKYSCRIKRTALTLAVVALREFIQFDVYTITSALDAVSGQAYSAAALIPGTYPPVVHPKTGFHVSEMGKVFCLRRELNHPHRSA
jgi:hypothetical protein